MRTVLLVMVLVAAGATLAGGPAVAASSKPVVSGVSPSSGSTDGGTTVTIKGERFHHVRKVLFGSAAGTSVHVKSAGTLTVRTPRHPAGTVDVRVETKAGGSAKTAKDGFKYKLVWTPREAPFPAHANAKPQLSLTSVACASAGSCVAVGTYFDGAGNKQGLVERLAAGHWEASKAPLPAKANTDPGATLNAVACPTSKHCVAVGTYVDTGDHVDGVIETLADGAWTAKKASLPSGVATGSTVQLNALACHGSGSCAAVGIYTDSNSQTQGLLETLVNGRWSAVKAHLPADATLDQNVQLNAVACPAAGACSAVGVYDNPEQVGLVETLANSAWHATPADLPSDASKKFQSVSQASVSCASATKCTAAGQYVAKPQNSEGLIETLPVGATSGSEAGIPSDHNSTPSVGLAAVSCAPGCTAAGSYRTNQAATAGLIEPLSGSGGPTRAPLPADAGTTFGALEAIACPATRSCTAVGQYTDKHGEFQGVLDIESGISWHPTEAPVPGNAMQGTSVTELTQIVCPSTTSCVAIGEYLDKNSAIQGLLEDA